MQVDAKKDLILYLAGWLAFGATAGLFSPVSHASYIWGTKLEHFLWGALFGAACGYAFTLSQNRFNSKRDGKITLGIAAALWMGFNLALSAML